MASRTDCAECAERLKQALELVRGEFLGGLSLEDCPAFDEWLFVQRERLHLQIIKYAGGTGRFPRAHRKSGDCRKVRAPPARTRSTSRTRPPSVDASTGRDWPGAAQRWLNTKQCRRLLADELGVSPAPETILLAEQIRALASTQKDAPPHNLPLALNPFYWPQRKRAPITGSAHTRKGWDCDLGWAGWSGQNSAALQIGPCPGESLYERGMAGRTGGGKRCICCGPMQLPLH